ncbi:type IV pilin [Halosimplex litoreum]|uniref:Type IV pilin n=1 Tax=Halosimplex litoreum TaxID=1198301 RepID=A0A7T3KVQ9_9EURY|nr:type IV pilin [Halosimplex litoreum]QPV63399.1 type IV pilin [Halosimplex litoreum]
MDSRAGRRAVSPVIGTVLLVAIAALLASVAAYVAFGATERNEPAPEVVVEIEPVERPGAYDLELTDGERLDGEKVEIRGGADENALRNRDLLAGDSVTVFPVRERLRLVWFGERDTSYVLREFEVEPDLPDIDENCPWVQRETNGGTSSVSIENTVVDCDVVTDGNIVLEAGGTVVGRVVSEANSVDIDTGLTVYGPVVAGDDVAIDGSEVAGDVRGPDVDIDTTTVYGSVESAEQVDLDGVTVTGHVYAPSLSCSDSTTIGGRPCSGYTPRDPDDY